MTLNTGFLNTSGQRNKNKIFFKKSDYINAQLEVVFYTLPIKCVVYVNRYYVIPNNRVKICMSATSSNTSVLNNI